MNIELFSENGNLTIIGKVFIEHLCTLLELNPFDYTNENDVQELISIAEYSLDTKTIDILQKKQLRFLRMPVTKRYFPERQATSLTILQNAGCNHVFDLVSYWKDGSKKIKGISRQVITEMCFQHIFPKLDIPSDLAEKAKEKIHLASYTDEINFLSQKIPQMYAPYLNFFRKKGITYIWQAYNAYDPITSIGKAWGELVEYINEHYNHSILFIEGELIAEAERRTK